MQGATTDTSKLAEVFTCTTGSSSKPVPPSKNYLDLGSRVDGAGKIMGMIEGSLEVKLPTIWTDEKQSREEAERRERVRRKKMQVREKVEKSRSTVFFECFVGPHGRKVGSLKQRVRSHLVR